MLTVGPRYGLLVLPLMVCSCAPQPAVYRIPPQHGVFQGAEPKPNARYVAMDNPQADRFIVRDVATGRDHGRRRWTFTRPELRFLLSDVENQKLVVNFDVVPETFKVTGPITVSFFVNGKTVGKASCPKPDSFRFEAPIDSEFLLPGEVTLVAAEADKRWSSPDDGTQLGFLLVDAGIFPR